MSQMKQQFIFFNDDEDSRQPETRAIMNWLRDIRFTASATLHGVLILWNSHNNLLASFIYLIIFVMSTLG